MLTQNGRSLSAFSSAFLHIPSAFLAFLLFSGEVGVAQVVTPITAPLGMPRRWEAGMQVSPYSTVNLRTGRMVTTLPVVGWEGRGPSISFSLYHNMTSPYGVLPIDPGGSSALMGDANGDSKVDEADLDPFAEIVLSESQTAQEVAVTDFSGDGLANAQDFSAFGEALMMMNGGPNWRHSYSMSLSIAGHIPSGTTRATLTRDDGTKDVFVLFDDDGAGPNPQKWVAPPGVYETLVQETIAGVSGYTLTYKNQWRARFSTGGVLQWIADATTAVVQPNEPNVDLTPKNRVRCIYYSAQGQPHHGKLWKVIDAANRELVLVYNEYGKLMTITDPVNRVWTLNYEGGSCSAGACPDGDGRFLGLQDPNPAHLPIGWDYTADNEIWFIVDKNNDPYTFTYDDGRLVGVDDPLQLDQAFSYMGTTNGEVIGRHYDRRGSEWQYWFKSWSFTTPTESTGQLTKVVNPLGETVQYYYNDTRNPAATPPSGAPDNWYAPHRHEVTARVNGLAKQWDFEYAPAVGATVSANALNRGNLATAADPLDNIWTFDYDGYNNLTSVWEPDGDPGTSDDILTSIAYESSIDPTVPTSVTLPPDANDQAGTINLTFWSEEGPEGYEGHARGKLRSVMDANGVETMFRYDTRGQLSRVDEGPTSEVGSWRKVFSLVKRSKVGHPLQTLYYGDVETITTESGTTTSFCTDPNACLIGGARVYFDTCTCSYQVDCWCVKRLVVPCPEDEEQVDCNAGAGGGGAQETGIEASLTSGYTIPGVCPFESSNPKLTASSLVTRDAMGHPILMETNNIGDSSQFGPPVMKASETIGYDDLGRVTSRSTFTKEVRIAALDGAPEGLTRNFAYQYDDFNGIYTRTGPDGQVTTVQTDLAGRTALVQRAGLSSSYDYYANGQVEKITYGNGTVAEYEYDNAERLKTIRHRISAGGDLITELSYGYNLRGLITSVTEIVPGEPTAYMTFVYDSRGRLVEEERTASHAYHLSYVYDQGGNRKLKVNHSTGDLTKYYYDVDTTDVDCNRDGSPDPGISGPECYHTKNNRLMYYETYGDLGLGTIKERVDYEYYTEGPARGNPRYIVRRVHSPNPFVFTHHAATLEYNGQGELWFITQRTWDQNECWNMQTVSIDEYRANGRNMRMTTKRDPAFPGVPLDGTRVWHDYDGEESYSDARIDFEPTDHDFTVTELAAHEPGAGMINRTAPSTDQIAYYHGDQIGSLRAVTDHPTSGGVSVDSRAVYTAFGERVWTDGTVGTRYQYAGAWGYQSELYTPTSNSVPFVHVGHRWYDPASGRFLQKDAAGIQGGLNFYEYGLSSPANHVDPSGNIIVPLVIGGAALIVLFNDGVAEAPSPIDTKADFERRQREKDWENFQENLEIAAAMFCLGQTRWLANTNGWECRFNKDFRVGWHELPSEGKGAKNMIEWAKGRNLPHIHTRGPGGIGAHRPWQPW